MVNLSYILTSYNKLPYLKVTLLLLIENKKEDEEIIVIDGGSTDGTVAYLNELYKQGKIQQFISKKDKGEAHGLNKGTLLAKGTLLKYVSDDDVYDYSVIEKSKLFMLAHPAIDGIVATVFALNIINNRNDIYVAKSYEIWFKDWLNHATENCFFCCLPLMLRRSSISYLGLFDTSFTHPDFEYSVRVTSKKATIAFCTDVMVTAIQNSKSISQNFGDSVAEEVAKVSKYYNYTYPIGEVAGNNANTIGLIKHILQRVLPITSSKKQKKYYPEHNYLLAKKLNYDNLEHLFKKVLSVMKEYNTSNKTHFLSNLPDADGCK